MRGTRTITITTFAVGLLTGSASGVVAQDGASRLAPEPFSGTVYCGNAIAIGTDERTDYAAGEDTMTIRERRGDAWRPTARDMSDPRLEGRYSIHFDTDSYIAPGLNVADLVGAGTWRIENDEGAWQGSYHIFDALDGDDVTVIVPLIGEGAYDGLTALVESAFDTPACRWDWRGLILDGELPAYPETLPG